MFEIVMLIITLLVAGVQKKNHRQTKHLKKGPRRCQNIAQIVSFFFIGFSLHSREMFKNYFKIIATLDGLPLQVSLYLRLWEYS